MRKLFWCGVAAAAVVAAAGTYLTADHASRHPDSVAGRCVTAAFRVTSAVVPLYSLGGTAARHGCAPGQAASCGEESCCVPDDPVPFMAINAVAAATDPFPACPFAEPVEVASRLPGKIVIADPDEAICQPVSGVPTASGEPVVPAEDPYVAYFPPPSPNPCVGVPVMPPAATVLPGDGVVPAFMSYCVDDQDSPSVMPYALDADEPKAEMPTAEESAVEFWKAFFKGSAPDCGKKGCPDAARPKNDGSECQEDPGYHHHYPGCPHSGYCPYSGKALPQAAPSESKTTPAAEPCCPKGCPEGCCPGKTGTPTKAKDEGKKGCCPAHPGGLDTMEFRKSDLRINEFGYTPF